MARCVCRVPTLPLPSHQADCDPRGALTCIAAAPQLKNKPVDLLTLTPETDIEIVVNQIVRTEPLISDSRKPQLRKLVYKLIEKQVHAPQLRMRPSSHARSLCSAREMCLHLVQHCVSLHCC